MKLFLLLFMAAVLAQAGAVRVSTFPLRHPVKTTKTVLFPVLHPKKSAHAVKVVIW